MSIIDESGQLIPELEGIPFTDPRWCYWLNVASLIFGFIGNFFLLMNFTQTVRYIVALPMSIASWYLSTGLLIAITACMNIYVPPNRPQETYTQGYWYAVIAAVLYCICSMILMINMLGYILGHYPQHFALTDSQRTLILQTMLFFAWLGGGAAVFSRVESNYGDKPWTFADGLYFCDVTILTVGFGDLYPTDDVGRGLVFPYSVGGIIMLGLVISSINKFVGEIGHEKIVHKHVERQRVRTFDRTVTNSVDLDRRRIRIDATHHPSISAPVNAVDESKAHLKPVRPRRNTLTQAARRHKPRLILLREERDRFNAMRSIEQQTARFKRWSALTVSVIAFGILWCVGAVVFWRSEKETQKMTYFKALYFCYVSLLTIGYGDLSPKSNAGRPFFVIWSLLAVPTMTLLVSDMGDTVISGFKKWTNQFADFTVLPKEGIWKAVPSHLPWLLAFMQAYQRRHEQKAARIRQQEGLSIGPDSETSINEPVATFEGLAADAKAVDEGKGINEDELARRLAAAIRKTANDLQEEKPKKYCYEEWVEYTQLIRFTSSKNKRRDREEPGGLKSNKEENKEDEQTEDEDEDLIEWDWIGENSPMMARKSEPEFVLDRLCESLVRYISKKERGSRGEI
ncbi:voltage-gated potassium channel [Patellaria atrata CBS 101060]|uniref:Voltage-gated potassium channel n=1 Tax=Patellaria atrata CBS 101060 TaxID=1346257 RepID=A0A9P4VT18_9PEZI|nr:voltage-gated potassium channel [Patellaria atrata CBS 101060]